jgi:hypothetical protein
MKTKSVIFILLIVAAASVVALLVWMGVDLVPGAQEIKNTAATLPVIESASISDYDAELDGDLKSFDADLSDLNNLANDPALNTIDNDMANFNL